MGILSYGYKAIKSVKPKPISKATKKLNEALSKQKKQLKKELMIFRKKILNL